jgi:prenyltransferase beta subunit
MKVNKYDDRCQTYEGGMGGYPGNEAHGGYSFCALAALLMTGKDSIKNINIDTLSRWSVSRHTLSEGGFSGRTNKLVDACYSWWMGGVFPLLHHIQYKWDPDTFGRPQCEYIWR